jgi:Family of unknown function (DUF5906)
MADTCQNPHKQGGVAVVLRGEEGVGKGFTVKNFGALFGRHYLPVTQASQVTGKFNGHLAECCVLFADEAFFAGDKQHEATLKGLITEDCFMVERKGLDAIRSANLVHLWVSSNANWVVPAGPTARRFFCLDVVSDRRRDTEYFQSLDDHMKNGGRAAFLDLLLKRNLTGSDIWNVPKTAMLAEQKALTRRGVDALIEWLLTEGRLPCPHPVHPNVSITCSAEDKGDTLYDVAGRRIPDLRYLTPTSITRALKTEWGCESWHSGNQRGIAFPNPEELRAMFIRKHGEADLPNDVTVWG